MALTDFNSSYSQKIQEAWLLRWNQKIDDSMNLLMDVNLSAGWDEILPEHLRNMKSASEKEAFVEALLLKASLLRAQGQKRKSSALLKKIMDVSDQILVVRGFRLLFELGIDHWVNEDLAQAMEYFLLASRKARSEVEKIFSVSNLLWCLESLDLPRVKVEKQLLDLIEDYSSPLDISHVIEQWSAYGLRKKFYTELVLDEGEFLGQSEFFKNWVLALPYYQKKINLTESAEAEYPSSYLWQGAYRQRTLSGIWLPSDSESVKVSDAIDRLYLWTWWWMADRLQINAVKIIWTMESILNNLEIESQGKESLILLRNSLSWIALLEPNLKSRFEKVLNALNRILTSSYPVLEIEFVLTQALSDLTKLELIKALKTFPVFYEIYKEIKEAKSLQSLPRLQRRLNPVVKFNKGKHFSLVVDISKNEIRTFNSYQVLKSKYLTQLISLLEKNGKARFEQLVDSQEEIDPRRIYNLVVRARKILSNSAIHIRGQEVIKGSEWPAILIMNDDSNLPEEFADVDFKNQKTSLVHSETHLQAAKALLPVQFTRKELETALKVSKATASRMIDKWLFEKLITVKGKAKAAFYIWTSGDSI